MPRYKEYNREAVLDSATKVFWEKGYVGSAMSDLVNATALNKHSMYKEFGSKEGLFLACIENFSNKTNRKAAEIIHRRPLGLQNIIDFFQNRIEGASSKMWKGCLIMNSVVEQEVLSEQVNEQVQCHMSQQEGLFRDCLMAAQRAGEIPASKDTVVLAQYLLCFLEGLNVMGKCNPTKESLELLFEQVLTVITH